MTDDPLETRAQFVRGVGPSRGELLAKLELRTVGDLLWFMPRDIIDLSDVRRPRDLEEGQMQTVRGRVLDVDGRQTSTGKTIVKVLLDCDGEYASGVWFNQRWMLREMVKGETVLFSAKPKRHDGRWEFSHPRVQKIGDDDQQGVGAVLPRYSLTEGLTMEAMRRILRATVEDFAPLVPDPLPEHFLTQHQLARLPDALRQLHLPASAAEYEAGRRRILFDDLFEFQLGLALRRRAWRRREQAPVLPTTAKIDARIRRLFPFRLTEGQNRATREIAADLASGRAMHRLVQADVGAGKTAVAVYAMLVAIAAGYQAVLMAPTEVLASQHWATIDRALAHSRVRRALLTGQLTAAKRRTALDGIRSGELQLVVGTQAVIQKGVEFQKLGVVVIDEQHKFGVAQRAHFSGDAGSPHVLVMTATPIPRSLCLTQFGDLDLTLISDLPPGRQRVNTSRVMGAKAQERAWDFIRKQLTAGRQAYIICPTVEATEGNDAETLSASAEETYQRVKDNELRGFRVGLVHGQLDRQQKAAAMAAFRDGQTQALVATTVVEVGVDVPNATLMVINQAHCFGLSQLHQLRGRISRGKFQGYCFLLSDADSENAKSRLHALESTSDGFRIAEVDFELRGPGDVLGLRQHGDMPLRVADLVRDSDLLLQAREIAFGLVESGEFDHPDFAPAKIRVLERFGDMMDLPRSG